jgi:hypothetical protein
MPPQSPDHGGDEGYNRYGVADGLDFEADDYGLVEQLKCNEYVAPVV